MGESHCGDSHPADLNFRSLLRGGTAPSPTPWHRDHVTVWSKQELKGRRAGGVLGQMETLDRAHQTMHLCGLP